MIIKPFGYIEPVLLTLMFYFVIFICIGSMSKLVIWRMVIEPKLNARRVGLKSKEELEEFEKEAEGEKGFWQPSGLVPNIFLCWILGFIIFLPISYIWSWVR